MYRHDIKFKIISSLTKQHIVSCLGREVDVWKHLETGSIFRSFATGNDLSPEAADVLVRILEEGNIPWDNSLGMKTCYQRGWIHKMLVGKVYKEAVILPSRLHEKQVSLICYLSCSTLTMS